MISHSKYFSGKPLFLLLQIILFSSIGFSEGMEDKKVSNIPKFLNTQNYLKTDIHLTGMNALTVAKAPLNFDLRKCLITTAILGATAVASFEDRAVWDIKKRHESTIADHFISPWQYYGQGSVAIEIGCGLYLTGIALSQPWFRETGREALTSIIITGVLTSGMKVIFGRFRPYNNKGDDFNFLSFNNKSWSFPSGHTATAFALSSVLSSQTNNTFAAAFFYGIATLTAAQRVYSNNHWLSDVIVGAALGTFVGYTISKSSKNEKNICRYQWEIAPDLAVSKLGISIVGTY